jgi:hypothetical protein
VGVSGPNTISRLPAKNSIRVAKIVTVRCLHLFQDDLRKWANGGSSEERVLISTSGSLVANANILTQNTMPTTPKNANYVPASVSYPTFAASDVTKNMRSMRPSLKLKKRDNSSASL